MNRARLISTESTEKQNCEIWQSLVSDVFTTETKLGQFNVLLSNKETVKIYGLYRCIYLGTLKEQGKKISTAYCNENALNCCFTTT